MRCLLAMGFLIGIFLSIHLISLDKATAERKALSQGESILYILPSPVLKISALEFDGLASDFMFLRSLSFIGSTYERKGRPRVKPAEWKWMLASFIAATDLDPYFLDPYYVAQAQLTWEAHMITETNTLLTKGMNYRDWDWLVPFFIGFNHFYFLHDHGAASEYLMEASRRPEGSPFFAHLAARFAFKAQRTESAILFLEELLKKTEEEETKKQYKTRLTALRGILFLENAVKSYRDKFDKDPDSLEQLVQRGFIQQIPADPYGGQFYIDSDGSIKTTSNLNPIQS